MRDSNRWYRPLAAIAVIAAFGGLWASACGDDSITVGPPTADVAVTAVKVLQGTTVVLAEAGTVVSSRNAPIIESRPARIRVFIEPRDTYTPRELTAVLTLQRTGAEPKVRYNTRRVIAASAEDLLETTFNFDLKASSMTTDLEWKVSINEIDGSAEAGDTSQAMLPRDGTMALMDARSMGGPLNIVIAPARYTFDGSNRVPPAGASMRELYRRNLYPQFPVSSLNITIRQPFNYDYEFAIDDGLAWSRFLNAVLALRERDGAPPTTYYYGVITPSPNESDVFCGSGSDFCAAGVGTVPDPEDTYSRAAVGLGYLRAQYAEVFTHEIGHTTGRRHAPCGRPRGLDSDYPHPGARLGATGYDIVTGTMYPASETRDFMSYCSPTWVSDYTFAQIFERLRFVHEAASTRSARSGLRPAVKVRAAIASEGRAEWGHATTLSSPAGDRAPVHFEDAQGRLVSEEHVRTVNISHQAGIIYWIPDIRPTGAAHVRLPNGRTLPL